MSFVRHCHRCKTDRPVTELVCQGRFEDQPCHWSLFDVLPTPAVSESPERLPSPSVPAIQTAVSTAAGGQCRNGHPLGVGDFLCLMCGESAVAVVSSAKDPVGPLTASVVVKGWRCGAALAVVSGESDLFLATREAATGGTLGEVAVFKHYRRGIEPEASLYPALRSLDPAHGLRLLDAGRFEERAFEIWEYLPLGTLGAIPLTEKADPGFVRQAVWEMGGALQALTEVQIIHRDLKPANVLVRSRQPLDLVLADFSTATVSEFDLQITMSRQTTRYAAPETIVGTCSAASDWWSLGVIVLEMLTQGRGFEGVHERAFLLHLVTRGLRVPDDLPEEWRELLMGLLTRDPSRRWAWPQVQRWLGGERGIAHGYGDEDPSAVGLGRSLRLGSRDWPTPESFAMAAAESAGWDEARALLLSGRIATWLQERGDKRDKSRATQVRAVAADTSLPEDARFAAALLILNENLPLCLHGEIVTPAWVLTHPEIALAWLASSLPSHLRRLDREPWFVRLRERADRVRARIRESGVECNEVQLSAALLATSQSMLEMRWRERRRLFPEAEHVALAAAVERRTPSEEDLIVLVSANLDSFRPAADVLAEAEQEAARAQVPFSAAATVPWLDHSRWKILDAVNDRLTHFVRCGHGMADQWADDFRQSRRATLARALVLLSIGAEDWHEPPQQDYVRNVLDFFHRRLVNGMQRGSLVRMTIGRSTDRLDLTELGGSARSAETLLSSILIRQSKPVALDPKPLLTEPQREQRLRRLRQNAAAYRRDTGISALYLGFPFVVLRDARAGEETKPRIAPVLLWPVRLEMLTGSVRLAFDVERSEVRINPALEGLLGAAAPAWREILDELRGRNPLNLQDVLDALAPLATPSKSGRKGRWRLCPLPSAAVQAEPGQIQLHAAGVLFLSDFSGQTIAEDLKHLAMRPIQGTALEVAIRAGMVAASEAPANFQPEADRYFTTAADPSQQAAVFRARQQPGLVVQGPPGTGKSQTIVNIVCDALGRGEKVLIVCQKLAALEVVRKRLETENLADRLFILSDPVSDRVPALKALRQQLDHPLRPAAEEGRLRLKREGYARQIETLEKELNGAHDALREVPKDRPGQLPYREVIEALLTVERGAHPPVSYAPLGAAFLHQDYAAAEQLIAEIAPLTPLWLEAKYEQSPLHCLAHFRTDEAALADFHHAFDLLRAAERRRQGLLDQHARFFDLETPIPLQVWLQEHETALRTLPPEVTQLLARWTSLLTSAAPGAPSAAEQLIPCLEQTVARLCVLDTWTLNPVLYEKLATRGTRPLQSLAREAELLSHQPSSFFERLNPARWLTRRRLFSWLRSAGADPEETDLATLQAAAELELALRDERPGLMQWREAFGETAPRSSEPLPALRSTARRLLERLRPVVAAARRVQACPVQRAAEDLRQGGDADTCDAVLDACRASLSLWAVTRECEARLKDAASWFDPEWVDARRFTFRHRTPGLDSLEQIARAFPTLAAFQAFRLRARALPPQALPIFELLRERDAIWQAIPASDLPAEMTRTLRREALLVWKAAAEQGCPALLMPREERVGKVRLLGQKDDEMRQANRELLAQCSAQTAIAPRNQWDDVVMLTGQRSRRLREVVERGHPLGLFHLRPVWMMNPEMACRLFPLQPGLFDLLIFDEASQLPVECALPALFRARRVVVSGDEKQMPPSRFFGSQQLDSDEEDTGDDGLDADDGGLEDSERERLRQAADRREVKDCPDLLSLAQNILPTATLEIHYRSKYRELINFSNAAFYASRLSVPARHPEKVVREARPLEVDRVNGLYADQTNEAEADRVVERLRELWQRPVDKRPSVGVVTFNLKQSDLIHDKLETLAKSDDNFRRALEAEQDRTQRGEDMGFFVKNLENVQGDERDWIIFSTTFGRDAAGTFRRKFGVLGQHGGERRLNVAVTRAREKVLLVTSLPLNEISSWSNNHRSRPPSKPIDFLQGWLAYAERLDGGDFGAATQLLAGLNGSDVRAVRSRSDHSSTSPFNEDVSAFLRQLGHAPVTAQGDAFGVDFALIDPRTGLFGLGIECDAPSHAVLDTVRARELWRPSVLAASIPTLHRVGLRAWYHDRTAEEERLRQAVQLAFGSGTFYDDYNYIVR